MKIRDYSSGYAIVKYNYWLKYGVNAYVERYTDDLEDARYIKNSLEIVDTKPFVIINCETEEVESY